MRVPIIGSLLYPFFRQLRPARAVVNVNCNKHVHVMYYNVRSLLPKLDELKAICATSIPDIVCVVETWLDNSILDNEVTVPNYQLFRLDRNRHGGGIAIYVHLSLSCNILLKGGPFELSIYDKHKAEVLNDFFASCWNSME